MLRRSYLSRAFIVAVAGLAIVGCGDDDETTSADTTGDATADTAAGTSTMTADDSTDTTAAAGDGAVDSGGTAGEVDPCELTADVDVEAILGEAVADPQATYDVCKIEAADAASTAELNVRVAVGAGAEAYEGQKELLGVDAEISDLGDEAFSTGTWVHVLSGENYLFVQGIPDVAGGGRIDVADLEEAARTVLANLG